MIVTEDKRLNYLVVKNPTRSEEVEEGMCGICPNVEQIQREKFDYYVPLTDEDRKQTKHIEPLPLSFMQIKEGDVDSGILWYKQHYPKVPDELIEIMARYNFGDLKYATRKSIRNNVKKYKKKFKNEPPIAKGLTIKNGPVVVEFD